MLVRCFEGSLCHTDLLKNAAPLWYTKIKQTFVWATKTVLFEIIHQANCIWHWMPYHFVVLSMLKGEGEFIISRSNAKWIVITFVHHFSDSSFKRQKATTIDFCMKMKGHFTELANGANLRDESLWNIYIYIVYIYRFGGVHGLCQNTTQHTYAFTAGNGFNFQWKFPEFGPKKRTDFFVRTVHQISDCMKTKMFRCGWKWKMFNDSVCGFHVICIAMTLILVIPTHLVKSGKFFQH